MIHVERMWHSIAFYRQLMQEFVAATPKSVKVAAGSMGAFSGRCTGRIVGFKARICIW
jgi:hypothetical protein